MISAHEYTLTVSGALLPITSGTVTLDETWSPYAQADVTIDLPDAATLAQLDPRRGGRALLTLAARYGAPAPVSDLTALWGAQPLSAITAAWAGLNLRTITAQLSDPYNADGHRDSSVRTLDLGVVERTIDRRAGTVRLALASDEYLAQDYRPTSTTLPPTTSVRSCVSVALARIGAALEPGTADATVSADAVLWEVGTSAWDYAHSLVDAAGLRLACDERRRWTLAEPLDPATSPGVYVVRVESAHELEEMLSREAWATCVIVTYRWEVNGVRQVQHDVAGSGSRVMQLEVDRAFPRAGAAAAILARVRARGSLVRARQIGTYDVAPGWVMQSLATDTAHQAGLVSVVRWDLATDGVEVSSRDLADTPQRAWIMQPAGYRWTDVPTGTTWQTYTTPTGV